MSREATSVACPRCGAIVGEPCTGAGGDSSRPEPPLKRSHWERFRAARADPEVRERGKWASPTQARRGSPKRGFSLPRDLHDGLDVMAEDGASLSAYVAELLRADPRMQRALADPRAAAKRAAREKERASQKTC